METNEEWQERRYLDMGEETQLEEAEATEVAA
jgi:hypothetical protein